MNKITYILLGCILVSQVSGEIKKKSMLNSDNTLKGVSVTAQKTVVIQSVVPYLSIRMVSIKGGEFVMGGEDPRPNSPHFSNIPKHKVVLNDFQLAETEVTQALWKSIMNNNPSEFKGDSLPVGRVSWNAANEFIRKLNEVTGKNYRLPTEAEWEYAAGGGTNYGTKFSGTNSISELEKYAWIRSNANDKTHPVATKASNVLGLFDMTGNVCEWCSDFLAPYSKAAQTNPKGPASSTRHIIRGGSWVDYPNTIPLYTNQRNGYAPESATNRFGFRLAMDAE